MAQISEWLSSNTRTAYPFVGPAVPEDLADDDFRTYFVDAYVRDGTVLVPGSEAREETLRLDSFHYGNVPPDTHDIRLVWDESGEVFFDSTAPGAGQLRYDSTAWGQWVVLEWIYLRDVDDSDDADKVIRVVLDAQHYAAAGLPGPLPIEPDQALLVPGLIEQTSSKVTTIRVINQLGQEFTLPDPALSDPPTDVRLREGYNTSLVVAEDEDIVGVSGSVVRPATRLELSFEPGAGLGRFPFCEDPEDAVYRINGVGPDSSGNVLLSPEGCLFYDRRTPGQQAAEAQLRLINECQTCIDCDDYVAAYNSLREAWVRVQDAVNRYNDTRTEYGCVVNFWEARAICVSGVVAHIEVYVKPNDTITFQFLVYNNTPETLSTLRINTTVTVSVGTEYVPGSGWIFSPRSGRRSWNTGSLSVVIGEDFGPGTIGFYEYEMFLQDSPAAGTPVVVEMTGNLGGTSFSDDYTAHVIPRLNKERLDPDCS